MTLTPSNCSGSSQGLIEGLQLVVFEFDCASGTLGNIVACESPGSASPIITSLSNLCVNNTYMVMIDGFNGDQCDFTLDVVPSLGLPPLTLTGMPTGPAVYCSGQTLNYSIEGFPQGNCLAGNGVTYTWTVTGGVASIVGGQGTPSIDVTFADNGPAVSVTQISVVAETICQTSSPTFTIATEYDPPEIPGFVDYCLGEPLEFEGQTFDPVLPGQPVAVTLFNYLGCDSVVSAIPIAIIPGSDNLGAIELCGNETFVFNGTTYTAADDGVGGVFTIENGSANGCDSTVVFSIVASGVTADIQASAPALDCSVSTVTLDGSGSSPGVTYEWTDANGTVISTNVAIDVTTQGAYVLTVTDVSDPNCFDSATFSLVDNSVALAPPVISGPVAVCESDMETYTIGNTADTVMISWTVPGGLSFTGQGTEMIELTWGNTGGEVIVTLSNDCGNVADTLSVAVTAGPDAPVITGDANVCADALEAYSIGSLPTGTTVTWTVPAPATFTGQGTPDISVDWNGSGNATLQAVLTNSCGNSAPATLAVTVESPPATPDLSGVTSVCAGAMETYTSPAIGGALDYTWTLPDGSTQTTTTPNLDIDWGLVSGGQLCIQANNDCGSSSQDCINVTVNNAPAATLSDAGAPSSICANGTDVVTLTISLTGVSPWTVVYAIDNVDQAPLMVNSSPFQFNVSGSGTYTLTSVTNGSGCPGVLNGSVTITEDPQPTAGLGTGGALCAGSTTPVTIPLNLTGTPDWTIQYSINGVGQAPITVTSLPASLEATQAGDYEITGVTDGNGCTNTGDGSVATVTENTLLTVADLDTDCDGTNTTYRVTFTIAGGDPGSYMVSGGAGTISGNTFTSDPIPSGNPYSFVVTDANNCNTVPVEDNDGVTCACATAVGTMDQTPIQQCDDGPVTASYNAAGENFDADDVLIFVLHTNPGLALGTIIAENGTPTFSFNAATMSYGTIYYISAVIGDQAGSSVDFASGCTQVAQGTPVTFFQAPTATLSGTANVCTGDDAALNIDFTGTAPFSITYTDSDGVATTVNGIMMSTGYVLMLPAPAASTIITLSSVTDANCPGTATGTGTIAVNSAPQFSDLEVMCNATSTAYTVSFTISGGDAATYAVTGGAGTITAGVFTSDPIPASQGYSFILDDANNCDPLTIAQTQVACDCLSAVGTVSTTPVQQCVAAPVAYDVSYDATDENLDGDDAREFILHTAPAASVTAANFIARSADGQFVFDAATMTLGTTYYISAVVGNEVPAGSGQVDYENDPCVRVSDGLPITFYANPEAVLSGDQSICAGESAMLTITLSGTPPFELTLSDGTVDTVFTNLNSTNLDYLVYPITDATYSLVSISNANCPGTVAGTATVAVSEAPQFSDLEVMCNATSTAYTVSFTISGGDAATYAVTGGAGTITAGVFTSDPIPASQGYSFILDDANNCDPLTIAQTQVACDCLSAVGTVSTTPVQQCVAAPVAYDVSYDATDENLDGDDAREFILHTAPAASVTAANFIARSADGQFVFDAATMTLGTTYYISAVVGNEVPAGSGQVDYENDPCVRVSDGLPITFYANPEAVLSGDQSICAGESAVLTIALTGTPPFELTLSDGTVDTVFTNLNGTSLDYLVYPMSNTTYSLVGIMNANCPGTVSGTATVEVSDAPQYTNVQVACNPTSTAYTVSFDIIGGDAATYAVTGGTGTITAGTFTSDPIPASQGYSFTLDDANGCDPQLIEQAQVICNCLTAVGMTDQSLIETCGNGPSAAVMYDATAENLDGDDAVAFILHTAPADDVTPTNFLADNPTGSFDFDPTTMSYGVTYFVSAVAGNEVPAGSGQVDYENDPCVQVSLGTPIVFYEIPTGTLSADQVICAGEAATLSIVLTGAAPFTITINDGTADTTLNNIAASAIDYLVYPDSTTTYTLTAINTADCPGTVSGTATVAVNGAPNYSDLQVTCNATSTAYTVSFTISGGDAATYAVTGDAGILTGNVFTSEPIPATDGYSFILDDANGCAPVLIEAPVVDCNCLTAVGTTDQTPITECGDGPTAAVAYDATTEVLDGDDVVEFILHGLPADDVTAANLIARSATGAFGFDDAVMMYGTVYYVSAVAGNETTPGSGQVDFVGDPCAQVSTGTPVVFYEIPTAALSGDATICADQTSAELTVTSTGSDLPFTITINDGQTDSTYTITSLDATITVYPTGTTTYTLLDISNTNCPGIPMGTATVSTNAAPTATNIDITSNSTNTFYTICFDIEGGDASSYAVSGLTGTIVDGQFCSDDIACGTNDYAFSVDDANGCGPTDYTGQYACNCTSAVGEMSGDTLSLCEGATAMATYTDADEFLDGNDARQFVLHDGNAAVLGNVLAVSDTPDFAFPGAPAAYGTTYYISAIVGDADTDGNVLFFEDPCLQVAEGTPVVWNETPQATLTASPIICEGNTATLTIELSGGSGAYVLTFDNGDSINHTGGIYMATFEPSADTTFVLVSVADAQTMCVSVDNWAATTVVTGALSAGTPLPTPTFCEGSGSSIQLINLLENADTGGTWTLLTGNPGTAFDANSGTVNSVGLAAGDYSFTYSVGGTGGCPLDMAVVSITISPQPTADAGVAPTLTCDTPEVTLGGANTSGGNFDYEWTLNSVVVANTATFQTNQAGIYLLTVFDATTGCFDTDEVEVGENVDAPVPDISVSDISCFGQQDGFLTINGITGGTPPYLCSFDGGPFSQAKQFSNLGPGNYEIVIQDSEGCQTVLTADLTEPQELSVTLTGNFMTEDNSILWGDSIELTVQTTVDFDSLTNVQWSPPLLVDCDTCQTNTVMPLETTQYGVTVQQGECSDSDILLVTVRRDIPVFVPTAFSPNGEGAGVNEVFFVQGDPGVVMQIRSFRVYNRWGEPVIQYFGVPINDPAFGWNGTFRGELLNPAVFVYAIEVELIDGSVELLEGNVTLMR